MLIRNIARNIARNILSINIYKKNIKREIENKWKV